MVTMNTARNTRSDIDAMLVLKAKRRGGVKRKVASSEQIPAFH